MAENPVTAGLIAEGFAILDSLDGEESWQWALNEMSDSVSDRFNEALRCFKRAGSENADLRKERDLLKAECVGLCKDLEARPKGSRIGTMLGCALFLDAPDTQIANRARDLLVGMFRDRFGCHVGRTQPKNTADQPENCHGYGHTGCGICKACSPKEPEGADHA